MARTRNGKGDFERSISTAERDAQATRLRAQGHTYETIAEQLSYTDRSHARKAVQRALKAAVAEPAEELRTLELERLDDALRVVFPLLASDDEDTQLKAVDRWLKVSKARCDLLGLNAPNKTELSGPDGDPISVAMAEFTNLPMEAQQQRLTSLLEEVQRRTQAMEPDDDDDS